MQSLIKTTLKSDNQEVTRLFSHIEFDGNKLIHQPGSVLGSTTLIAGTTVGVGILALPAVTMPSGIMPSSALLIAVWLYTLVSGLMIAEVTLNTMRLVGHPDLGMLVIVESTLGVLLARITAGAYLFVDYALLVAYIVEGGEILVSTGSSLWGVNVVIPEWVGTTTFALLFGGMMYFGREKVVEKLNNAFVAIVIASFLGILLVGTTHFHPAQLFFQDWSAVTPAASVMLVALFYHNIIPVIVAQLEGDARKIRTSIVIGSLIPLMMFLAWNAVILGSVSSAAVQDISSGRTIFDPLKILRSGSAGKWLEILVSIFSEFAIVTSFIGVVYSLLDLFKGISNVDNNKLLSRQQIYSLILIPTIIIGVLNPSIFFTALDYTGTFSISFLVGIIPALMTSKQRQLDSYSNSINQSLVPSGKVILVVMIGVASLIIVKQIL